MTKVEEEESVKAKIYRKYYYRNNRQKLLAYQRTYYATKKNTITLKRINKKSNWRGEKIIGGFIKNMGGFVLDFD